MLQTLHEKSSAVSAVRHKVSCHTAAAGEVCYDAVTWAMEQGIHSHPEWYPTLSASSSFEAFQRALHQKGGAECPEPCASAPDAPSGGVGAVPALPGWRPSGEVVGEGHWCKVGVPAPDWNLLTCYAAGPKTKVKVLSYNLFWWNLFGHRGGNGRSAGRLIARTGQPEPYDIMGFQECDDAWRILGDAGLADEYGFVSKGMAIAIAYRRAHWSVLEHGMWEVAEDRPEQWYGKRAAQYARLRHKNGRVVFFVNHHGPLPVGTGGKCGGRATAYNLLRTIASNAHTGDQIIMVGDFNANAHTSAIQALDAKMHRVFSGVAIGGIDHIYSNCGDVQHVVSTRNLGAGGSDHDALSAVFDV